MVFRFFACFIIQDGHYYFVIFSLFYPNIFSIPLKIDTFASIWLLPFHTFYNFITICYLFSPLFYKELLCLCVCSIPMLDCQIPILNSPYARWRKESINTILLFNTTTMVHNNPLLLTNFLGAFIWQKIVNGYTVGQIRQEMYNRFGLIGVLPFLQRLYFMGFIKFLDSSLLDLELPEKAFLTDFPETSKAQNVFIQTRVPWYLLLEVNTSCQLRCTTCYQNDFSDSGLSTRQLLRLIDDIVESEVLYVTILGGEPTLRKDLITVIKRLRENGVFVKLITNGLLFDEQQACSLAETFINQVEVSFDGISPATHDRSRGVGNFDKAIKAIGVLQRAGISRVAIIVTIDNVNIHEMSSLPRFLDDLNVKEVLPFSFQGSRAWFYSSSC